MYINNNIAYADVKAPALKVCGVRPLNNYCLWVRFNNGESKIFDFKPLLNAPALSLFLIRTYSITFISIMVCRFGIMAI